MQGNACQKWVKREFDKIKLSVNKYLKENNSKTDSVIRNIKTFDPECKQTNTDDETCVKSVVDTDIKVNDVNSSCDAHLSYNTSFDEMLTHNHTQPLDTQSLDENTDKSLFDQPNFHSLINAIHNLEVKLVEFHLEYSSKVDALCNEINSFKTCLESLTARVGNLQNQTREGQSSSSP